MSLWGWILGLTVHVAVTMVWGGIVGGVLYLACQAFRKNKT